MFEDLPNAEALYCLQDFKAYKLKGRTSSKNENYSLTVTFEVCTGDAKCQSDALTQVNRQSFHFPMQSSYFNPTLNTDSMILEQMEPSLVYPS